MSLNSHIGKTWITRIHSLTKRGDQFLSRTREELPMNLTQILKWDWSSLQCPIAMMTTGHRIQLHLHLVHHHRCPPKTPQDQKLKEGKKQKTTRPDEKPSTTISPEPDTRGSDFGSTRPRYNLRPRKRRDIPKASSSRLPHDLPPEGPSPELETEDNESLYATNGGSP